MSIFWHHQLDVENIVLCEILFLNIFFGQQFFSSPSRTITWSYKLWCIFMKYTNKWVEEFLFFCFLVFLSELGFHNNNDLKPLWLQPIFKIKCIQNVPLCSFLLQTAILQHNHRRNSFSRKLLSLTQLYILKLKSKCNFYYNWESSKLFSDICKASSFYFISFNLLLSRSLANLMESPPGQDRGRDQITQKHTPLFFTNLLLPISSHPANVVLLIWMP